MLIAKISLKYIISPYFQKSYEYRWAINDSNFHSQYVGHTLVYSLPQHAAMFSRRSYSTIRAQDGLILASRRTDGFARSPWQRDVTALRPPPLISHNRPSNHASVTWRAGREPRANKGSHTWWRRLPKMSTPHPKATFTFMMNKRTLSVES